MYMILYASDLTAYDSAKQVVLRHTKLKDNIVTHAIARYDYFTHSRVGTWINFDTIVLCW